MTTKRKVDVSAESTIAKVFLATSNQQRLAAVAAYANAQDRKVARRLINMLPEFYHDSLQSMLTIKFVKTPKVPAGRPPQPELRPTPTRFEDPELASASLEPVSPPALTPAQSGTTKCGNIVIEKSFVVGPFANELVAGKECEEYRLPSVMRYRTTVFPQPETFKVTVHIIGGEVVKLDTPELRDDPRWRTALRLYPYGVRLTMKMQGQAKNVLNWCEAFNSRNRIPQGQ